MQCSVNPVFAILGLISVFFLTAVSWVLLNAEFLAFVLILIYVGAIVVLLLFVIMFIDQKNIQCFNNNTMGNKFILVYISLMSIILSSVFIVIIEDYNLRVPIIINDNNIHMLGQILFTNYLLPIAMVGLLLLSAIIAVVCLKYYD